MSTATRPPLPVLAGLMLAVFLAALDGTIVATALPTIVRELGDVEQLPWVVTSFLLAATVATPLWGKLGDTLGRKRIFIAAIAVFLVGSALAGLSQSIGQLTGSRALQGLGAGGLTVTAQAIVADLVSARERGRYLGMTGAVHGVASVVGPLVGGFIVDHASWRWVFLVNLPLGAIALMLVVRVLTSVKPAGRVAVDYAGMALLTGGVSCLVLLTSLGGTSYPWGSPSLIALAVAAVLLLAVFVVVERRVLDPVLPPRLFRDPVFTAACAIAFAVGMAMFGALTFVPLHLQVVLGLSATASGLFLVPLVLGLVGTAMAAGRVISRTGRYRAFPIVGTVLLSVSLALLTRVSATGSPSQVLVPLLLLGLGLGLVLPVLVIVVQNAAAYRDLGTATSGVSFFQSVGGALGVAIFGALFAARLASTQERLGLLEAHVAAVRLVFLVACAVGAAAFLLSWLLREVPLREVARAVNLGELLGMPEARTSWAELERALSVLVSRDDWRLAYEELAQRAGVELAVQECWLLARLDGFGPTALTDVVHAVDVRADVLSPILDRLEAAGLVAMDAEGGAVTLTSAGRAVRQQLQDAGRDSLAELVPDWPPDDRAELGTFLSGLARSLLDDAPLPKSSAIGT